MISPIEQRANDINQYINSHNRGKYGEERISAAVESLNQLRNEVQSGKLSQSDYIKISDSFLPTIHEWSNKMDQTGGSTASKAVLAAGLKNLNDHFSDYNIYKSGQQMLGRDLTPEEIAMVKPIFSQENGVQLGNAWLAQLKLQEAQNPSSPGNVKKSEEFSNQVNDYFKNMLGRDATADEKTHFGSLMATGNLDAYGLNQFLQGSSEYQSQQDKKFRSELGNELQQTDLNFFNRAKQGVISQFMQNGTYGSSALDSALTDLMGQIADKRSQYMADLSSNQYKGNKDLALGNYKQAMNDYINEKDYNRGLTQKNMDYYTGRSNELTDYQTQKNDWMNYMNNQKQPSNFFNYLNTGLNAINTGANVLRASK